MHYVENKQLIALSGKEYSSTFNLMNPAYKTLLTIFEIVKSDPAPTTYLCTPHEIILRHSEDWADIQPHLEELAKEKLITTKQLDKVVISITAEGITKAKSLKNNFVNNHYNLPAKVKEDVTSKNIGGKEDDAER